MGLSRKPMPPRKQPLRAKKRLAGTGLSQSARAVPVRKPLRSRPKPRTREEVEARRLVAQRAGPDGMCEGCGRRRGTDWAHRVGRGVGGPWDAANGLWLCSDLAAPDGRQGCHERSHANPHHARQLGWILRSTDNYLTHPAWIAGRGYCLLTRGGGIHEAPEDEENAS